MTVLFGHPGGNPNSHNAALAHFEAGWLEAFCVPWMPTPRQLRTLSALPGLKQAAARLSRRHFAPLRDAPKVQGRAGEWWRMARRLAGGTWADERLAYEANDWLMGVMRRESRRAAVSVVHAYEDCSLWQFQAAAERGLARVYDLPIGYYPAWEATLARLTREYADWLPETEARRRSYVRPEQKRQEMALADLVLVPSSFARRTVLEFTERRVALAPYGVDAALWRPDTAPRRDGPMRFLYAGQCSIRKGTPLLLEAWRAAALGDAVLDLVGSWQLAERRKAALDERVVFWDALSPQALSERYRAADVFVFPSHFEGFGLVILEALSCGLPVIASDATAGPDVLDERTGRVAPAGDLDAWVDCLRWAHRRRNELHSMRHAARERAITFTWARYRQCVRDSVRPFV
jgi:glycosyltransferase involved in cell wall biosynthesis